MPFRVPNLSHASQTLSLAQALAEVRAQLPAAEARARELASPGGRGGRLPSNPSPGASPSPGSPASGGRGRGGRGGAKDAAAQRAQVRLCFDELMEQV